MTQTQIMHNSICAVASQLPWKPKKMAIDIDVERPVGLCVPFVSFTSVFCSESSCLSFPFFKEDRRSFYCQIFFWVLPGFLVPRRTMLRRITAARPWTSLALNTVRHRVVVPVVCCQQRTVTHSSSGPGLITTPIFYVNSKPHIGHLYSTTLADTIRGWQAIKGERVLLSTGTDEHGLKIQQAAAAANKPPIEHCDHMSEKFKALFDRAGIKYSAYIRTTSPRHRESVERFWNTLCEKGFIYKGSYSGWYSASDEAFVPELNVVDGVDAKGNAVKVCKETSNVVEWSEEVNYMFRLSSMQERLLQWLDSAPGSITPGTAYNNVYQIISDGLEDLSVSRNRKRLEWGIPVPGDDSQTIYVWLDALVNYLTVSGYPKDGFSWPPFVHVLGQDIAKFHCIYWPAFLMAADLPLPQNFLVHSHWTMGSKKMSKSKGNVVSPDDVLDTFGVDATRYFMLSNNCISDNYEFSEELLLKALNELADIFGNLAMRLTSKKIMREPVFPVYDTTFLPYTPPKEGGSVDLSENEQWLNSLTSVPETVADCYDRQRFDLGLLRTMQLLRLSNSVFQNTEPWRLGKSSLPEDAARLQWLLRMTLESLVTASILFQPAIPTASSAVLSWLNVPEDQRNFQRIDRFRAVVRDGTTDDIAGTPLQGKMMPLFQKLPSK